MTLAIFQPPLDTELVVTTNGDAVPLVVGMPVALLGGQFARGNASSQPLSLAVGLVRMGAAMTLPVQAQASGSLILPTAFWDVITAGLGGLLPDAIYYLSTVVGQITTTPPNVVGQSIVELGRAISSTELVIRIRRPVLL